MEKGKCNLCLKENVYLLTKSHIIPKFLFDEMKDDKFQSFVQLEPHKFIEGRNQHIKFPRDAFHESNILCLDCDGKLIKKYEDYLKLVFFETNKPVNRPIVTQKFITLKNERYCKIENLDYNKYKLGFLSILWRASISSLDFFKSVSLGEKHNERIRQILYNEERINFYEYPFLTSLIDYNDFSRKTVLPITKFRNNGIVNYRFIINGIDLLFMISNSVEKIENEILDFIPKENGIVNFFTETSAFSCSPLQGNARMICRQIIPSVKMTICGIKMLWQCGSPHRNPVLLYQSKIHQICNGRT